jgi:ankyrin repeat protein
MNTDARKHKSFKHSLNSFLRALTRRRRNQGTAEPSSRFDGALSARGVGERKVVSSYNFKREDSPVVPLSARGPNKSTVEGLVASAGSLKRRLSIDNVAKKTGYHELEVPRSNSSPQAKKLPVHVRLKTPDQNKAKRLSVAVKKHFDEKTNSRTHSAVSSIDISTAGSTPPDDEIRVLHTSTNSNDLFVPPTYVTVDSDSTTTQTESTMDDSYSSAFDEDEETIMNSLPPPTFTLDEYTHSMMSFDERVLSNSTDMSEEKKIEDRILQLACQGNVQDLRALLDTNLELLQCTDKDGSTPMHQAARYNRAEVIEMLIEAPFHADINSKDNNESTPLHWASVHGALDAILALCRNGAQINIRDKYGKGPLHLAVVKKCYRGANVMLLYGADINFKRADGSSAFHIACELGDLATIEWLVTKDKVMVNCRDKQGETPLLRAATQGKLEVVEYIMKTQLMSWNARDDKQQSLLHRAAFYGYYDLISRIAFINPAACKTMLNEPDRNGDSPLHMAVKRDHFKEMKLLCKMGADPSTRNKNGDTPLHVAVKYKRTKIVRYLYMTAKEVADVKNKRAETPRIIAKRLELNSLFE